MDEGVTEEGLPGVPDPVTEEEPVGLDPGGDEETALQATTDFVGVSEDAQRSASPPPPPPEDESPEERLLRQKRELRTALERNDPDAVREILDAGVPLAIILDEDTNATGLHLAASHGSDEVVKILANSATIQDLDVDGCSALHRAVMANKPKCVEALLAAGASMKFVNKDGWSSVHLASSLGFVACLDILLDAIKPSAPQPKFDIFGKSSGMVDNSGAAEQPVAGDGRTPLHLTSDPDCVTSLVIKGQAAIDSRAADGRTPLHAAVADGRLEAAQTLITLQANCRARAADGATPLIAAAARGRDDCVRLLLDSGADPSDADKAGLTALHAAASGGHPGCIAILLDKLPVSTLAADGRAPLHCATNAAAVVALLDSGADPNQVTRGTRETPLHTAVDGGHHEAAEALLKGGAKADKETAKGRSALQVAAANGHADCIRALAESETRPDGAKVAHKTSDGTTALHHASNRACVEALLAAGAPPSEPDANGLTPLHAAAERGAVETLEALIDGGVPAGELTPDGLAAIHLAAAKGDTDVLAALLGKKVRFDARAADGSTPIHHAGTVECMKLLLKSGARLDAVTTDGKTPLIFAASKGASEETIQVLLEGGCSVKEVDKNKRTAVHWAARGGHAATLRALLSKDASPDARTVKKATPLHEAAEGGHVDCINVLLSYGVSRFSVDDAGNTPLHVAALADRAVALQALVEKNHGAGDEMFWVLNGEGKTALAASLESRHGRCVLVLLRAGAVVNEKEVDMLPRKPAHFCAQEGYLDYLKAILAVDPSLATKADPDTDGSMPIHAAAAGGKEKCAELLVTLGSSAVARDLNGATPMLYAAREGQLEFMTWLVSKKAKLDEMDNEGSTAVFLAAANGHFTTVMSLLGDGVASDVPRKLDGKLPLHAAADGGHVDIVRQLLSPSNVNAQDLEGNTPLHLASNKETCELILSLADAAVNKKRKDGKTALHIQANNIDCVRLLLGKCANTKVKDVYHKLPLQYATTDRECAKTLLLAEALLAAKTKGDLSTVLQGQQKYVEVLIDVGVEGLCEAIYAQNYDGVSTVAMSLRLSQALDAASMHFRSTSTVLAESLSDLSNKMELLAIAICRTCPCWAYTASFGQTRQVPTRTVERLRYPVDEANEGLKTDVQLAIELERKTFVWGGPRAFNDLWEKWQEYRQRSEKRNESLPASVYAFCVTGHPDMNDPGKSIQRDILYFVSSPRNRFFVNRMSFLTFLILIVTLEPVQHTPRYGPPISVTGAAPLPGDILYYERRVDIKQDVVVAWWLASLICSELQTLVSRRVRLGSSETWGATLVSHLSDMWNIFDFFSYGLAVAAAFTRGAAYAEIEQTDNERYLRGVAGLMLWFRFVEVLALNLYTGPLLSMVFSMIKRDIGRYLILQLFVVLAFACFFSAVFNMDPDIIAASGIAGAPVPPPVGSDGLAQAFGAFGNMRIAVQHLIELTLTIGDPASGGMWAVIDNSDAKILGWFFMALFALLSILLLVNLLIAMFGATFTQINDRSDEEFMAMRTNVVVESRDLPLIPAPLNLFWMVGVVWPRYLLINPGVMTIAYRTVKGKAQGVSRKFRVNKVAASLGDKAALNAPDEAVEAGELSAVAVDNGSPSNRAGPVAEAVEEAPALSSENVAMTSNSGVANGSPDKTAVSRPPALTVDGNSPGKYGSGDGKSAGGGGDSSPVGSPRGPVNFFTTGSVVGSQKAGGGGVFASSLPDDAPENWLGDFEGRLRASETVLNYLKKELAPQDWREEQHRVEQVLELLLEAHNQAEAVRAHAEAHAAIRHSPVITPGGARLSTSGPRVVAATSSSRNFSGALGSVPEDGEIPSPAPGSKDIRRSQDIAVSAILDAARTASGQNLSAHLPPSPAAESPSGRGKSR